MLMLELRGRLGNCMFEYASVAAAARRRGLPFAFFHRGEQNSANRLDRCFRLGAESPLVSAKLHALWNAVQRPRRRFRARLEMDPPPYREVYDERVDALEPWTVVRGGFQSELYFAELRDDVLAWFTPRPRYRRAIERIDRFLPAPAQERVCIHVRRGNYATAHPRLGRPGSGWILPTSYYREALARLPRGLFAVVITDDAPWAREFFGEAAYIAEGNAPLVDMFLMTLCRYNVIANSSFSWWGAWCNRDPGRVVIAPRHHLGWAHGKWVPGGMEATPRGWDYLDCA
jgi:hypothetical protein